MSFIEILKRKIIDTSKPEFKDLPKTLEGEILLEVDRDPKTGRILGYVTVHPDRLDEMFSDAVRKAIETGRKLSECLIEADDVYDETGRKIGEREFSIIEVENFGTNQEKLIMEQKSLLKELKNFLKLKGKEEYFWPKRWRS